MTVPFKAATTQTFGEELGSTPRESARRGLAVLQEKLSESLLFLIKDVKFTLRVQAQLS